MWECECYFNLTPTSASSLHVSPPMPTSHTHFTTAWIISVSVTVATENGSNGNVMAVYVQPTPSTTRAPAISIPTTTATPTLATAFSRPSSFVFYNNDSRISGQPDDSVGTRNYRIATLNLSDSSGEEEDNKKQ